MLSNKLKNEWLKVPTIGYYSGFTGIEIKSVNGGYNLWDIYRDTVPDLMNDYTVFVAGAWCSNKTVHYAKIYYNDRGAYFKYKGVRISFADCIRC